MDLRRPAVLTILLLAFALTGCSGDDDPAPGGGGGDPQAVLAEAKKQFDEASSVHFTMKTDSEPSSGDAVLGADGTLTQQPAFEGEVKVLFAGLKADVPIVAVDGKVYGKLPLTPDFAEIDPAEYGAPDPADFIDPASGISGLLLKLEGLEEGERTREGKQVLTTYEGTLSGDLVQPIIPSASADGSYDTVVGIDEDGRIATLQVTGDFFAGGEATYDLVFDDYGADVTVRAP